MIALFHGDVRNPWVQPGAASLIQLASAFDSANWKVCSGGDLQDMFSGIGSGAGGIAEGSMPDLCCVFPRPATSLNDFDAEALELAMRALQAGVLVIMTKDTLVDLLAHWRTFATLPTGRDRLAFTIAAWQEIHRITGETLALEQGEILATRLDSR